MSSNSCTAKCALGDRDFHELRALILRESGIELSEAKRALLVSRLQRRLRDLEIDSYGAYYRRLREDPAERIRMFDRITTNETSFFREPSQFAFLEDRILPAWREEARAGKRPYCIRAWSAGCATGEEPYSLAMTLLSHFPSNEGWRVEILASDLSTRVLSTARTGVYPISDAGSIPEQYLRRYMRKGRGRSDGLMRVGAELRRVARFARLNLHLDAYPSRAPFDLVLCRNVLIYFQDTAKKRVIDRLLNRLSPEGLLLLGHSESLQGRSVRVRRVMPSVYAREAHSRPSAVLSAAQGSR